MPSLYSPVRQQWVWELPWRLGAQQSRTKMLPTQWHLHTAAFYDRLLHRMCLCQVALSCSHCDVINSTLDIGAQLPFYLGCYKLPPMCRCPMSDIIIGLTLIVSGINLLQNHINSSHLTWIMSVHYLVKLKVRIVHVLPLSCWRKILQKLSHLNCGTQICQIWIHLIIACAEYCKRRCAKCASLIWTQWQCQCALEKSCYSSGHV